MCEKPNNYDNNINMVYTLVSGKKLFPIKSLTHHQHLNSDISNESTLTVLVTRLR